MGNWQAITDLEKKLPAEVMQGLDPISFDTTVLQDSIEEAEDLLLARLAVTEDQ